MLMYADARLRVCRTAWSARVIDRHTENLAAAATVSLGEALDQVDRPQAGERRRFGARHTHSRARQVRRGGEVQNVCDIAQVIPRILCQFRRGNDPYEIDDAFEVRRTAGGERAAQM